jgi:hypothetical protein
MTKLYGKLTPQPVRHKGLSMTTRSNTRHHVTTLACLVLLASGLAGVSFVSAQSQAQRDADYYNHIKPELDKQAAETAAILARPSNWGPGEIRSNVNYSALAWYPKRSGEYGYVFYGGSIRDVSASMGLDIYCSERKIMCEGTRVVMNEWLAVGTHSSPTRYVTATGATRAAAEAAVHAHCLSINKTCTVRDTFSSVPHPRGAGMQRLVKVVR